MLQNVHKKETSKQNKTKPPCGRCLHYLADCSWYTFQMLSDIWGQYVKKQIEYSFWYGTAINKCQTFSYIFATSQPGAIAVGVLPKNHIYKAISVNFVLLLCFCLRCLFVHWSGQSHPPSVVRSPLLSVPAVFGKVRATLPIEHWTTAGCSGR